MKVLDLMTKKPAILDENASVMDAIKKMESIGCGVLPVGDLNHIKGVITDRDIMMRAVAKHIDLSQAPVKDIMSKRVIWCDEDNFLQEAVYQMNLHNIRRILVKNKEQQLSGILSLGDIIRRMPDKKMLARIFRETSVA